ncbi:MAG: hypothetical protein H6Q73_2600 [Firmicutes bacterium]|nr:hypothetical protein [Bacillota bacterium]
MNMAEHYRQLFYKYGDSPEANQWSNIETQEMRFKILTEIADLNGAKIIDFGCGTAHLATYLKEHGVQVDYTGVDIVEEMLEFAGNKYPEYNFCRQADAVKDTYDYAFVSGTFNNLVKNNRRFYRETIANLFDRVRKGLAFNMLSYYVDYYDKGLFYEKPEEAFAFVKQEISPYVILRNEYQLKTGIVPFEFTIYVYRK